MVIHTKEKAKLHIKQEPEAKIKGRNTLVVERSPKIARANTEGVADSKKVARKVKSDQKNHKEGSAVKEEVRKSVQKENGVYAQYHKSKQDREKTIGKKNGTVGSVASVGAKATLDQMESGNEVYESYIVARNLSRPVESATDAGRRLYRSQAVKAQAKRIKKVQTGRKTGKKAAKDSAAKAAKETTKVAAKKVAKETAKATAKVAATTAGTAAGTAATGAGGVLIGAASGEAAGIAMDRKDVKNSTRNCMIQLFVAKLRQEENQGSMGKRLEQVTEELVNVRKQLEKMEQEKANKTLKVTVCKAVDSLEQQCQKMKKQLFEIKIEVKAKASEILAETKAKGKAALHKVSEFLGVKDKLESVRDNIHKSIGETEQTMIKLDALGSGMREAG